MIGLAVHHGFCPVAKRYGRLGRPRFEVNFEDKGGGEVNIVPSLLSPVTPTFTRGSPATTFVRVTPYLRLPGVTGNYASTPDSAAVHLTGDIDIRVKASLESWTVQNFLIAQYRDGVDHAFSMRSTPTGTLVLYLSQDGTALVTAASSVSTGFAAGSTNWVRVTWSRATQQCTFFTSADGESWTQLGTTQTLAVSSIFDSTVPVEIGSVNAGAVVGGGARFYYAEIRNGIDGDAVIKFDPAKAAWMATSFESQTGETWTINQSGSPAAALIQGELVTVGNNVPRAYYDPSSGVFGGYLPEVAGTNLFPQSGDFSTSWVLTGLLPFGSGSTANAAYGPDGTKVADLIIESTAVGSVHGVGQSFAKAASALPYVLSVWVQQGPGSRNIEVEMTATGGGAFFYFAPSTGAVVVAAGTFGASPFSNARGFAIPYPGGIYRVVLIATTNTDTTVNAFVRLANGGSDTYTGDGTSGMYLWGGDLKQDTELSTHVPTTTGAATRAADSDSYATATFLNDNAGVFVADWTEPEDSATVAASFTRVAEFNGGTSLDRVGISGAAGPNWSANVAVAAVGQAAFPSAVQSAGARRRAAFAYAANDFAASFEGGAVGTDSSGSLPTIVQLCVGHTGGISQLNAPVLRIAYWDKRPANDGIGQLARYG